MEVQKFGPKIQKSSFSFPSCTRRKMHQWLTARWSWIDRKDGIGSVKLVELLLFQDIFLGFTSASLDYPLCPSPPIPGIVPTGITFAFTYRCTQFLCSIHPLSPFLCPLPSPSGKGKKLRRWIWLIYTLDKNGYRILKPTETTIR
jgi:hypothetical protein